jgi:apolipoprotein N-acyltransferase
MQSSEIAIQERDSTTAPAWLDRFSLIEKAPPAFLFGCVLGLSSPGFDLAWLAWIALAPLLVLIRSAGSRLEATCIGFVYGAGYYLVALNWYLGLMPLRWLGLEDWVAIQAVALVWVLESLHEAILVAAFAWLVYCLPMRAGFLPHWRRPFVPFLLSVPLIWVFLQWIVATSSLFFGMPVNQLAYTQHGQLELIQMARLGGSGLVDFVLVLANCAAASFIIEQFPLAPRLTARGDQIDPRIGSWVDVAAVSLIVFLLSVWGANNLRNTALETRNENEMHFLTQTPAIPVAVLQGNVTIEEERLKTTSPSEIAKRYAGLGTGTGALILFLPEGAIDPQQFAPGMLLSKLKGIIGQEKKEAVVGTVEQVSDGLISAARIIAKPEPKNDLYVKQRLVPFGETAPWGAIGQISSQLTAAIPSDTREHLVNVRLNNLLDSMFGKIGVSISNELIFPELVADEVRRGAQLLVNVTNLSRFHAFSLNKQFVAAATLRAVENGRFIVLSTDTGVSAVIDPAGVVTTRSLPGRRGVLLDTVQFLYKKTPFTKMNRMWSI